MKQRRFSVLVLLVFSLVAGILSGCGSSNESSSPAASASAPTATTSGSNEEASPRNPEDYKGEITVWTWYREYYDKRIADFNSVYPNVKVNLVLLNWGDYLSKFETVKASGGPLPDIALAESYWWGKMLNMKDTFVNLEDVGFELSELTESAHKTVVNAQGQFIGVPQGLGVGVVWYRKDLAKQYFGTDDPNELSAQFATWEDFFEAGRKLKEDSNGKAYLVSNATDMIEALIGSYKTAGNGYADGRKLTIAENLTPAFKLLEQGLNEGFVGKFDGPAMDAAWSSGDVVFFPSAAWRAGFIPSYDAKGKGRWGAMLPPGGSYFRGGTAEMIVDNGDANRAELAALFLRHSLYTDQGMAINVDNGNISAVQKYVDNPPTNGADEYYGVDLSKEFYGWLKQMPATGYGAYDSLIEDQLKNAALEMQKSGITAEQAVDQAVKAIKDRSDELE